MAEKPQANEFKIPVENLPELHAEIAKLNKRAEKLGLDPILVEEGERETVERENENGVQSFVEVAHVTVTGNAPKLHGWQFVATLEHDEGATIIRRIPTFEEEVDLTPFRNATPANCDHCHRYRRRNDTYIVFRAAGRNGPNLKQVGSNCLKDFTGHKNPQQIARFLEQLRDHFENWGRGGYWGPREEARYSTQQVLADAAMVIRTNGWVSKNRAYETDEISTATVVERNWWARVNQRRASGSDAWNNPDERDEAEAARAIEWVRSLTEKDLENDYLYNLYAVVKNDTIRTRQFGIGVSAIFAYQRHQQRENEHKTKKLDEWVGSIKERGKLTFTVLRSFTNESVYNENGIYYKHILRDSYGRSLIWNTTKELEQGKTYTGKFTIKDHKTDKYGKVTVITNPSDLIEAS